MNIELNEELIIECIKNYYRSVRQEGRVESFEKDLKNHAKNILLPDYPLSISTIQITNGTIDCEGDKYYDGVIMIPYRFWLIDSSSRLTKSESDSFSESQDSVNS